MSHEPVDSRYLYEQIYGELKEEILSGKYRKGDWFPPERVLKDRFNTTHLTVRNALAKLVLEGYIERYSGKGTLVIYARERSASRRRSLKFSQAHVVLSTLDETNAFLLESLETRLRRVPLAVRFSSHHGDLLLARSIYAEAQESGALVILEPAGPLTPASQPDIPLRNTILIRSSLEDSPCPQVLTDDAEGAGQAVRHMLELGYRRIAFFTAAAAAPQSALHRGFVEAIAAGGLAADSGFTERCAPGADGGARAARALLSRDARCRAFLCASDETAAGVMTCLRDAGLPAGVEAAVIGYGNTKLAAALRLTSIDPGFERLAERVVVSAVEGMDSGTFPEEIFLITPELAVRDSCAPPR